MCVRSFSGVIAVTLNITFNISLSTLENATRQTVCEEISPWQQENQQLPQFDEVMLRWLRPICNWFTSVQMTND